jgi:hypothetical protein
MVLCLLHCAVFVEPASPSSLPFDQWLNSIFFDSSAVLKVDAFINSEFSLMSLRSQAFYQ